MSVKKRIGSIAVLTTMLISNNVILAKTPTYVEAKEIPTKEKQITVMYNDEKLEFDQPPIIEDDRTKVPFRKVFESMGCIVYYNANENKIMALTKEGDILTHTIGTKEMELNGEVKTFDSASTIINDRTLIPLRAVAETLKAEVKWDEKNSVVDITKEEQEMDSDLKEVMMHVLDVNYNPKDTKRYVEYKKKNPDKDINQIIMEVNMDLDRELEYRRGTGFKDLMHYEARDEDVEIIENPDEFDVYINKFNALPDDFEAKDTEFYGTDDMGIFKYIKSIIAEDLKSLINDARSQGLKMEAIETCLNPTQADMLFFDGISSMRYSDDEAYVYNRLPQGNFSELRTGLSVIFNASASSYEERMLYLNETVGLAGFQLEDFKRIEPTINENKKSEQWLRENAYRYGFIERYPKDKSEYTRYDYSPNFYRYVGKDVAYYMHENNLSYDEYYSMNKNPVVNDKEYSIEESTHKVLQKY